MATKDEKEKSFSTYAGEIAGSTYGGARKIRSGQRAEGAKSKAKAESVLSENRAQMAAGRDKMVAEFGSAFASSNESAFPTQQGNQSGYGGQNHSSQPRPTEYGTQSYTPPQSAVQPTSPAAEVTQVNRGMPEPQPADMMADSQGYLPQDYVMPGMLARPESQGGGEPFSGKGSSFSTVSGPQNDLSVAAQFNKQADMMAAQNKRKGPAVYSNNAIAGDMSGGGNIGVARKDGGGIQKQIKSLLSSMPYGSAGDRAKRNSILKQASILMNAGMQQQKMNQMGSQFNQEMAFKQNNADSLAEQYAMGYAQKENQFGQDMAFKQQQAMQQQGNVGNQLALDYYKANKTPIKESQPFRSFSEDDAMGNSNAMILDQRSGETRPASGNPVNEEIEAIKATINAGVKSKKYTPKEAERMLEMMGATRRK